MDGQRQDYYIAANQSGELQQDNARIEDSGFAQSGVRFNHLHTFPSCLCTFIRAVVHQLPATHVPGVGACGLRLRILWGTSPRLPPRRFYLYTIYSSLFDVTSRASTCSIPSLSLKLHSRSFTRFKFMVLDVLSSGALNGIRRPQRSHCSRKG